MHTGAADTRGRRERYGTRVAQTAFVDGVMSRGDACGRLYDPARPYRTVKGAVDAIRGLSPLATAVAADPATPSLGVVPWTVRAAPGVYAEDVVLPPGIGLVGAGRACTIVVGSVVVEGGGRIEALSVRSPSLPAVAVVLTGAHVRACFALLLFSFLFFLHLLFCPVIACASAAAVVCSFSFFLFMAVVGDTDRCEKRKSATNGRRRRYLVWTGRERAGVRVDRGPRRRQSPRVARRRGRRTRIGAIAGTCRARRLCDRRRSHRHRTGP
ncbi:hypothetical protein [Pandoravirus japonicus]|uniref:Uncharacterized protein n=1 Tax=Pandoravirus japonicus TaxID=2823154 RepID=A0A811BMS5_9VIRU|nr:hypothetical protein [Pandoravirus japonicus]